MSKIDTKYTAWIWKDKPSVTTPRREHTGLASEAEAKQWIAKCLGGWTSATEYGIGHQVGAVFVLDFGSNPVKARAARGEDPRTHWWNT